MENSSNKMVVLSVSPHTHSGDSVRKIMISVILAMLPAAGWAFYRFGLDAVRLMAICIATCVAAEYICRRMMGRDKGIDDYSAVVTGMLLAFNLPPALPSWMAVLGSLFAIVVAKQLFGGLGYNPFNPALIGRVVLLVSFPVCMTTWSSWTIPAPVAGFDAVTTATPLGLVKTAVKAGEVIPYCFDGRTMWQFFIGFKNGCIGEVSGLALLAGGIFLIVRRCVYWYVPVTFLASLGLFAWIMNAVEASANMGPVFHILTGGAMLGAFFMATDMVTTPVTRSGMIIFGIGCGVLTFVIRKWGGYPEGVSFAILIMNAFTPLINRMTRPRVFGHTRKSS